MAINPLTGEDEDEALTELDEAQAIMRRAQAPVVAPSPVVAPVAAQQPPLEGVPAALAAPAPPAGIARPTPTPEAQRPILAGQQVTSQRANPEVIKAAGQLDDVAAKAEGVAGRSASLGRQEAGAVQGLYDAKMVERDRLAAEAEAKKAELRQSVEKGSAYLEQVSEKVAKTKITDWFDDQTDAVKLQTSVAMGLGAFGAALRGGENQAMRIIEGVMARDRAKKLGNLANLREDKKEATESLDKDKQRLAMADVELRAAHDGLYRNLEHERAAVLSKFGADRATIEGDKLTLAIREAAAKNKAEMFKGLETTVTNQYAAPAPSGPANVNPENVVHGPGGKPLFAAPNKEMAKAGNELATSYRVIKSEADKLEALIKQGRTTPGSPRDKAMTAHRNTILLQIKNLEQAGALDNGTVEIVGGMVPKDAGVMGNNAAALPAFREFLQTKSAASFDAMGVDGQQVLKVLDTAPEQKKAASLSRAEEANLRKEYASTQDPRRRAAIRDVLKQAAAL
jgi:hypothetical protein